MKKMGLKGIAVGLSTLLFVMLLVGVVAAEYPSRMIEFVNYSSPGGGTDRFCRAIEPLLEDYLGTNIAVDYLAGGGSARCMTYVMDKPADGYVLMAMSATVGSSYHRGAMDYGLHDLIVLGMGMNEVNLIVTSSTSPYQSIDDVIVDTKKNKILKWAISNLGSADHLSAYGFNKELGMSLDDYEVVPFNSGAEALTAALSGDVDLFIGNPSEIMGMIEAGELRPLLLLGNERLSDLPDVPTAIEKGIDLNMGTWRAVAVKAGTPDEIVAKLDKALEVAFKNDAYKDYLQKNMMEENWLVGEEVREFVAKQDRFMKQAMEDLELTNSN